MRSARSIGGTDMPGLVSLVLSSLTWGDLAIYRAPALETVLAPRLDGPGLWIFDAPRLTTLKVDSLRDLGIDLRRTGLTRLSLPSFVNGPMVLMDHPNLSTIHAPLWKTPIYDAVFEGVGLVGTLSLPSLQYAEQLTLADAPDLRRVELNNLETLGYLDVRGVDALEALIMPQLDEANGMILTGPTALTTLDLPSLTMLTTLTIEDHPSLTDVSLPALGATDWRIQADDNPAWCVTAEPILASPPPGCWVAGTGNLCDPP